MPAQADPNLALELAKATADLYAQAQEALLHAVARRIARGITEEGWAERKLAEVNLLLAEARAELAALTDQVPATVRTAVEQAYGAGAQQVAAEVAPAAGLVRTSPAVVQALVTETVTRVTSTHAQVLRSTVDTYRQVIAEVAAPDVLTGARTHQQAAQQALDRFARRGIVGFTDRAGRQWRLDSYVEMATRTAVGRAQVAGALDRYEADGRDLVIVSDAPRECSACRPWEGRVLAISDRSLVGTHAQGGTGSSFPVKATVDDATRAGLLHPNCRHRLRAFVPGLTRRMTDTEDPEGDRARQEQRRLERGVRDWKRREAAALTPDARKAATAKRRQWEHRLGQHVDDNNLKHQRHREAPRDNLGGVTTAGRPERPQAAVS